MGKQEVPQERRTLIETIIFVNEIRVKVVYVQEVVSFVSTFKKKRFGERKRTLYNQAFLLPINHPWARIKMTYVFGIQNTCGVFTYDRFIERCHTQSNDPIMTQIQ